MPIYFVFTLSFLNGSGVFANRVVLSLYALALGAQPLTIGILAATFSLFPMLLAVKAGRLTDRYGARWLLTFGAAGSGLGMLVPYFVPGLPAVMIAGAMSGFSQVFFNVSTQNLTGLLSKPHERPRNFSNYSLTNSAANLVGPLMAGFSVDHADHATACLYLALFALVPSVMLALRGNVLPGGTAKASAKDTAPAGGGVRAMLADPAVRRTLITGSLLNSGINLYQFYMPVYAHAAGLSASAIGIVLAMYSAAAFVVRVVLPRLIVRFNEDRVLATAFFAGAASLLLIPLFKGAVMLGLISLLFGLGMGVGQPIVTMLMFNSSADGRSGEALGLKITTNQLTKLVSPVVFGGVASAFGLFPMFWINALIMAAAGLLSRPGRNA